MTGPSAFALEQVGKAKEFFAALTGEDELGAVVRAHIHIENELERYIALVLPNPERLGSINYAVRVRLALACGLRDDLRAPLKIIGSLRNRFAHRLGEAITDTDADSLFASFPAREKTVAAKSFANTKEITDRDIGPIDKLSAKDRLSLHVVVLWGALVIERVEAIHRTAAREANTPTVDG